MKRAKDCKNCEDARICLDAGPKLPRSSSTAQRAYRVGCVGVSSIVFEDTAGRAKAVTLLSAKDAGYNPEWKTLTAQRAPEFDGAHIAAGVLAKKGTCYNPEYLVCAAGKPMVKSE